MVFASGIMFVLLASVAAMPVLEPRDGYSASTLSTAQIASYTPYTYYAAAGYCTPVATLAWTCANCNQNPSFTTIASGGDGAVTQYWFVGYDSSFNAIHVVYQGTDADKILPLLTDTDIALDQLDSTLFPGVDSSVLAHDGFIEAHARSASVVLAAVKKGMSTYNTSKITVIGHSLGGAIAILASAHLALTIPFASVKTVSFSTPRVGNQAFADLANALSGMTRINNKKDIIPIIPGRFLGYVHTEGEVHITTSNSWVSCPGQDNTAAQCTIGTVPNILAGSISYHNGPFNGIEITCS